MFAHRVRHYNFRFKSMKGANTLAHFVPLTKTKTKTKVILPRHNGLHSQQFIFFVTYEWNQEARVLHYTRLERLASDKNFSLVDPFCKLRHQGPALLNFWNPSNATWWISNFHRKFHPSLTFAINTSRTPLEKSLIRGHTQVRSSSNRKYHTKV